MTWGAFSSLEEDSSPSACRHRMACSKKELWDQKAVDCVCFKIKYYRQRGGRTDTKVWGGQVGRVRTHFSCSANLMFKLKHNCLPRDLWTKVFKALQKHWRYISPEVLTVVTHAQRAGPGLGWCLCYVLLDLCSFLPPHEYIHLCNYLNLPPIFNLHENGGQVWFCFPLCPKCLAESHVSIVWSTQ